MDGILSHKARLKFQDFISGNDGELKARLKIDKNLTIPDKIIPLIARKSNKKIVFERADFKGWIDWEKKKAQVVTLPEDFYLDLFLRVVYSHHLLKKNGFFLHASGLVMDEKAYIFFGPPQSGKSTILKLLESDSLLADELVAFRDEGKIYIYGTPFHQGTAARLLVGQVAGLFQLIKSDTDRVESLGQIELVRELFKNIEFGGLLPAAGPGLLNLVGRISQKIPGYKLYFKKDSRKISGQIQGAVERSV